MAYKFVLLAAFVSVARAGVLPYAAPLVHTPAVAAPLAVAAPIARAVVAEDYDHNPQYSFGYDVQDSLTGDNKNQVETRSGNVVQGSYSLNDADGTRRIVDYTADDVNGFNAVVRKEPLVAKAVVAAPAVAKIATPAAVAVPTVARLAAPALSYAAPHVSYTAPHVSYSAPHLSYSAPIGYAAPALTRVAAPYAYAAPAHLSYSANLIH
ncbi:larval cuticle protein A3A-like [Diorhabda carinulata]|uniref:larval cuticle protein A3A-like n=1 Tax=Diorhabda carinulata TaxID=1163345 RepID=UPI0025A1C2F1|nr:larval cuticle protein A3A-like [Diorhabda carinulata]